MAGWITKFANAGRGVALAIRGQSSFSVHLLFALLAGLLAISLRINPNEGILLFLTIALVFCLELVNTSIEFLAKAVTDQPNENVRSALDISAGAVLVASLFAIAIAGLLFLPKIWPIISG